MACIAMFILKMGSRNEYQNQCKERKFKQNFAKLFGVRLLHPDTCDRVIRQLQEEQLETLKSHLVRGLIRKKRFDLKETLACRAQHSKPAVDAFFAPVAFRVQTYALPLAEASQAYVERLLALPAMQAWTEAALAEPWREPSHEEEIAAIGEWLEDRRTDGREGGAA